VCTYDATHWSVLTKIDTIIDGATKAFFMKEYRGGNAKDMVEVEYASATALYARAPDNIPEPCAYGCFASDSQRVFYIQAFRDMKDELPDVDTFVSVLAKLHQKELPTRKFGFHMTST
jgi:hypothetical protein